MLRRPPRSQITDPLFPNTTLFRALQSVDRPDRLAVQFPVPCSLFPVPRSPLYLNTPSHQRDAAFTPAMRACRPPHGAGARSMSPQKSKDPGELSLRPSASAGGGDKKADFSNVQGKVDTVPADKGKSGKADFSNVEGKAEIGRAQV